LVRSPGLGLWCHIVGLPIPSCVVVGRGVAKATASPGLEWQERREAGFTEQRTLPASNGVSPASVSSFSVAILIPTRTDIEPSCGRRTQRPIPAAARCTRAACALSPIAGRPKRRGLGGLALPPPAGRPLLRLGSPAHCSAARLNRRFRGCSISKIRLVNYHPASFTLSN